jgi:deoxyribodipyrimidine photo-lyase
MTPTVSVFWFRRDLRLHDNAGLFHALQASDNVLPLFIFDKHILDDLEEKSDKRVAFIHKAILNLQEQLVALRSSLKAYYGYPTEVFKQLIEKYTIEAVYTNHDYEPYAKRRDEQVAELLSSNGIKLFSYKDQVIFEKKEIAKESDLPYIVFSPYARKWLNRLDGAAVGSFETGRYDSHFYHQQPQPVPDLSSMGFASEEISFPSAELEASLLQQYEKQRNFPGTEGTSRIGVHLRFGTVSIRKLVNLANQMSKVFLNELIWREFYQMILWNFPEVGEGKSFKPEYDRIEWLNNEDAFEKWTAGNTGYPIVDAGMRQLNETGFMHNRIRMVVASFLTKHLLIDWRWGEAYFAQKLLDFEFASNNGGWQWASGSGCDAAPFFRIFNPYIQTRKFDPDFTYISRWVPEFQEFNYPQPIVEHDFARKRCLEVYNKALRRN